MTIRIVPDAFRQFGKADDATFCLITNSDQRDLIRLDTSSTYRHHRTILFDEGIEFQRLLRDEVPERAHVLVVSPSAFFESPPTGSLGPGRKLLALACNSTPTGPVELAHFLRIAAQTDPEDQEQRATRFFGTAEQAAWLQFRDPLHGTLARFDHLSDHYVWNQQAGWLQGGEQQLAPSGEISVLPQTIDVFQENLRLAIRGSLTLYGVPILHGGRKPYERSDQFRLWQKLDSMRQGAILVEVDDGLIRSHRPVDAAARPACEALDELFASDPRYRIVWEIGFAVHTGHEILAGNQAMNETFGGRNGTVHFGLGLTPYTTYHLDLVCPGTEVTDQVGNNVHGGGMSAPTALRRVRNQSAGCGCVDRGARS